MNLTKLDKRHKFYLGVEIGNSLLAKTIQLQTHSTSQLPLADTATHVLILVQIDGKWFLYESHIESNGVRKYEAEAFEVENRLELYPFSFDIERLNFYRDLKYPYGYWDLTSKIFNLKNDGYGIICSEYLALCDSKFKICRYFNLKANLITPAHIQRYCIDLKLNKIVFNKD